MIYPSKNLFQLIQNPVISSIALYNFVIGFYNNAINKEEVSLKYPKLEYLFFVLPIIYNQRSLDTFVISMSMRRVIEKDKSIVLGLQNRAIKMVSQTYDGLNIAFCKSLLTINKSNMTIEAINPTKQIPLPSNMKNYDIIKIQRCATRLGNIFAKTDERNLQIYLNIRF